MRFSSFGHSAKWSVISNTLNEGIGTIVTFIIAGLVSPSDFGLVAFAMTYIAFLQVFVGLGFNTTLVQKATVTQLELSSVFWLNLLVGCVFFSLGLTLAIIVGSSSQSHRIILALSLLLPLESLAVVQEAVAKRAFLFKSLGFRTSSATFLAGLIGIWAALGGLGVWALVLQSVCRSCFSLLLLWTVTDWRPQFSISIDALLSMREYAWRALVGQIGIYVHSWGDSLLIGLFLGPAALGVYRLANRLVEIALRVFARSFQAVSLTHFSRDKDDISLLRKAFLESTHLSCAYTLPVLAFIGGSGSLIFRLLGDQWSSGALAVLVLSVYGILRTSLAMCGSVLQAVGRPGLNSILTWAYAGLHIAALLLFLPYILESKEEIQPTGVGAVRLLVYSLTLAPSILWMTCRILGLPIFSFLSTVSIPYISAILTLLAVKTSAFLLPQSSRVTILSSLAGLAICAFALTMVVARFWDPNAYRTFSKIIPRRQ